MSGKRGEGRISGPGTGCRAGAAARRFRPEFPIHHLDYSRAGFGQELDRDLRLVCQGCHTRFHRWDRPRGLLRACGVSLRWVTYMVFVCWLPVRLVRGLAG